MAARPTKKTATTEAPADNTGDAPAGVLTLESIKASAGDPNVRIPETGPSADATAKTVTLTHKESGGKVTVPERMVDTLKGQGFK